MKYTYPTLKIRNFGIEDKEVGSSSIWLLKRFKISKLIRLATAGGTTVKENNVLHNLVIILMVNLYSSF